MRARGRGGRLVLPGLRHPDRHRVTRDGPLARATIAFVGRHNSGKTTLLAAVLPLLVARGLRVGYLKHAHEGFEIDHPGKDSYRARRTGVLQTIVSGGGQTAVIDDAMGDANMDQVVARYLRSDIDLLVVEGFKRDTLPKIEVARAALSRELVCGEDPSLVAIVCDFDAALAGVPRFALDDAAGVAAFVAGRAP